MRKAIYGVVGVSWLTLSSCETKQSVGQRVSSEPVLKCELDLTDYHEGTASILACRKQG